MIDRLAVDRARLAAADRGVQHPEAALAPGRGELGGDVGPDRAQSMMERARLRAFSKTPPSPSATASTSGESGTIVTTTSASRTASATRSAPRPPAATSASTGVGLPVVADDVEPGVDQVGRPSGRP